MTGEVLCNLLRVVLGLACIGFGLLFIDTEPFGACSQQKRLATEGVRGTAEVRALDRREDGETRVIHTVEYRFRTGDGDTVTHHRVVEEGVWRNLVRGSRIEVIYDREDPGKGYPVDSPPHPMSMVGPVIGTVWGAAWVMLGVVIWVLPVKAIARRTGLRAPTGVSALSGDLVAALQEAGARVRQDKWGDVEVHAGRGFAVAGMAHLKRIPDPVKLFLGDPQATDRDLARLAGMTKLKTVSFFAEVPNPGITDAGLAHLAALTDLEVLNLWGTSVTDEGLSCLKNMHMLKVLILSGHITDSGLRHLTGLRMLKTLEVTGSRVTEHGIEGVRQALPKCEVFDAPDAEQG